MPKTLLDINSSPMGAHSISRRLNAEFVERWKEANPDGKVIARDLTQTSIPVITAPWILAIHTPDEALTSEQREMLTLSDSLVGELQTADEYVIAVPMHNFSIPSVLKLWIDQIVRANKTFSYATGVPAGLLTGKKATIIIASGGSYDAGSPMESWDFAAPYLRTMLGFLGITDVTFINAGGAAALRGGMDPETFFQPHLASVRAQFPSA
jgi:FMN-dependent NADH-azoreductase